MTDKGAPGQQSSNEGDDGKLNPTTLEERVVRLEVEMAALQRRVASGADDRRGAWRAVPAERSAPVAPPPPAPAPYAVSGAKQLVSGGWGEASSHMPLANVPESRISLESRLGSQIFNRIAIVLLLIGTACFLKLAVDRRWIVPSPTGRVIVGLLAGAALVLWSERFRHKGFAAFSYSLKAVGSGVLYLSLWAAFQLYHLLPAPAALVLMILVTVWNAMMAWAQDSQLLAVYAMAGGFATPMLLSTGGNHENFLFTYVLGLDLAIVALVRLKTWTRLLLGAFPMTAAFFIGWYASYYKAEELTTTSIFVTLFAAVFASVALSGKAGNGEPVAGPPSRGAALVKEILLPLVNAAFVALAFYCVLQDSGHHALLPWMMVVLAAAYLGLMRAPQSRTASAVHLTLAVVLLTIAIPLKANGHWITVSWLVEGLALLWAATRLETGDSSNGYASQTLRWLASTSLLLGFTGVCIHLIGVAQEFDVPFWNKGTDTALTGIAVFAVVVWLALRASGNDTKSARTQTWNRMAMGSFLLIALTASLLTLRELTGSWFTVNPAPHFPFCSADFFTAILGLAVLAAVVRVSIRIARGQAETAFWVECAALSTIAFNLIAVMTGVREIAAIWERATVTTPDAALQQALAISGFLMVYGAGLLAVGFWRRSGFLRWQALVLLVFTILKTFLYDMRNLSEGYRVVSLLGLGALLMAISFAYQKDWLGLRDTEKSGQPNPGTGAGQ
jgi:uncharacterized membrane protein